MLVIRACILLNGLSIIFIAFASMLVVRRFEQMEKEMWNEILTVEAKIVEHIKKQGRMSMH